MLVAVLAALAAGAAFAVSSVLQQRAARAAPRSKSLSPRLVWELAHRRVWLVGIGTAALSFGLQALALAFGPLSLVQPLIVCELLFAIPLSVRAARDRLGWREWVSTGLVAGGLAAFLATAAPAAGRPDPSLATWGVVLGGCAVVSLAAVAIGRPVEGPARASLFAVAGGTLFGLQAALTKTLTHLLAQGLLATLTSWQPYLLAVVALVGLLLEQSAWQAGPLPAALPVFDAAEPVTAILIGVFAFHERLSGGPVAVGVEAIALVALLVGIVALDRSPMILRLHEQGEQRQRRSARRRDGGSVLAGLRTAGFGSRRGTRGSTSGSRRG